MRKRIALLAAVAALVAACDSGVSDPPQETTRYTITISGPAGEAVGAALISVDGPVRQATTRGGWGLVTAADDGSIVAAVLGSARPSLAVELEVMVTGAPAVELLQVADSADALFPGPGSFTVEVRELEEGS